jgi:site-specific recombinase XerC
MDDRYKGIYKNIMIQVHRLRKQTNKGSIETRYRYEESNDRFAQFLAEKFRLQNFENVKEKHFTAYAEHMVHEGYSGKTIRTDLSGIRYFHELSGSRFTLPTNAELEEKGITLPNTNTNTVDRAWTDREIEHAKMVATSMDRQDVVTGIDLARNFGLRVNELSSLRIAPVKEALDHGYLHVKGKGGVERDIPVRNEAQIHALEKALTYAQSQERNRLGEYVLAESRKGGVLAEKSSLQNWLGNHREKFQDNRSQERPETRQNATGVKERTENVSWHGLRYAFAQERYSEALEKHIEAGGGLGHTDRGHAEYHARVETSLELGHFRDSVTLIYLSTHTDDTSDDTSHDTSHDPD